MTCKNAGYDEKGQMICKKDYPIRLTKCLKGGSPCYKPREKGEEKK